MTILRGRSKRPMSYNLVDGLRTKSLGVTFPLLIWSAFAKASLSIFDRGCGELDLLFDLLFSTRN